MNRCVTPAEFQALTSAVEAINEHPGQQDFLLSSDLLRGSSSIAIDHLGTRYVLRATRTGKLILTK